MSEPAFKRGDLIQLLDSAFMVADNDKKYEWYTNDNTKVRYSINEIMRDLYEIIEMHYEDRAVINNFNKNISFEVYFRDITLVARLDS